MTSSLPQLRISGQDDVVRAGVGGPQSAELDAVATRADVAPAPYAELANDDVVNAVVVAGDDTLDRDAGARRGLTGDRDERLGIRISPG
jgi:hypothetical protein